MLKKFNLDSVYAGNEEVNGEHFMVEDVDDGPGAFRACLDVGLSRTSTGANVSGAMSGAADGGNQVGYSFAMHVCNRCKVADCFAEL